MSCLNWSGYTVCGVPVTWNESVVFVGEEMVVAVEEVGCDGGTWVEIYPSVALVSLDVVVDYGEALECGAWAAEQELR